MKAIKSIFKLNFLNDLQYRAQALAGISAQFFFGIVFIMVYVAFYESGSTDSMKLSELVTYIWLGQAFYALIYVYHRDTELLTMIKNGDIAYELVRPESIYFKWYIKILSSKTSKVILRFLPIIIISLILPKPYNLSLPYSKLSFILFIISLFFATFLVTSLCTLFNLFTFFTMDDKGTTAILGAVSEILSGEIVPLPLMPKSLVLISNFLPFRYISDLPFRIYSGNISISSAIPNIIIQFIWIFIMLIVGVLVSRKILKKVVVQGG